jgi:hypothetical protein
MFDWARWSSLETMAGDLPGVGRDGWLSGWTSGFAQHQWQIKEGLSILNVQAEDEAKWPCAAAFQRHNASVTTITPDALPYQSAEYDLVVHFSFARARCFQPCSFEHPFARLESLLAAAALLKPGGVLFWSYPYVFPTSPESVFECLEPAAVFQALTRRGYIPLEHRKPAAERLRIYFDPDTLFVDQEHVLQCASRYYRITRVFGGVYRPGAVPVVQPLHFFRTSVPDTSSWFDEVGTRTIGKVFAARVFAKIGRCFTSQGGVRHV